MECLLFHKQIHVKYMLTCVRWQLMKNVERVLFYQTFKMISEYVTYNVSFQRQTEKNHKLKSLYNLKDLNICSMQYVNLHFYKKKIAKLKINCNGSYGQIFIYAFIKK